jgi:hypothetical protein
MKNQWFKRILFLGLLGCSVLGGAQTVNVTAQLTDADGVAWSNATCAVTLIYRQQYPPILPYRSDDHSVVPQNPTCTVNGGGAMSVTVTDVNFIPPIFQPTWQFVICPNVTGGSKICGTTVVAVNATITNISSQINLPLPRLGGGVGVSAYADVEVSALSNNFYQNTSSGTCRQYLNGSWQNCGTGGTGGGGATFPAAGGIPFATSTTTSNKATSVQLVTQLNTAPLSSTLAAALIPILNQNTSGNAATATFASALAGTPTQCGAGNAPTGILANGNATGCQSVSGGGGGINPTSTGVPFWNGTTYSAAYIVGTAANNLVQLNGSAVLPALSAINLTNIPVANASGSLPIANGGTGAGTAPTFSVFGNFTNGTAAPGYSSTPVFSAQNLTNFPTLNQSTNGNAATATVAQALAANPSICATGQAPQGVLANGNATGCQSVGGSGGGAPIFTHTLSGATPTAVVNSTTVAALDTNYLPMTANVTAISLPASTGIADGEVLTFNISQPSSGSTTYTLSAGTAGSPFTAGSGTTLVNTIPGGCPNIGTIAGASPSQLIASVVYKASLSQYQVLGCQTYPAQTSVVEATMTAGSASNYGQYNAGTIIGSTKVTNAGHFTNLEAINTSTGTCTTPPTLNVKNYTQATSGTALLGPTSGNIGGTGSATADQAQTLSFNAGDQIVIVVQTSGTSCPGYFLVSSQYAAP